MSLWYTDENNNEILLYTRSKETIDAFKKKHGMSEYRIHGFLNCMMSNETFKRVKEKQKEEFYNKRNANMCNDWIDDLESIERMDGVYDMPADAKHMFGAADRVLRDRHERKNKKKKGLLLPNKNKTKEPVTRIKIGDHYLTIEECISKGYKVKQKIGDTYVEISPQKRELPQGDFGSSITNSDDELLNRLRRGEDLIRGNKYRLSIPVKKEESYENVMIKSIIEERIDKIKEELDIFYEDERCNDTVVVHKEGQLYAYKSLLRKLNGGK